MPSERDISRQLAAREGGECEVRTLVGFIDVLTPKVLYEVKEARGWKSALGQVLAYGRSYPDRKLCLYLYGTVSTLQKRLINGHCTAMGVAIEWHREDIARVALPAHLATPLVDGLKLMLSAYDYAYCIRASCHINLLTPTAPIPHAQLDAYLDDALTVFDALLDNEVTLKLVYRFADEHVQIKRIRASTPNTPLMYRLHLSIMTKTTKTIRTSLPGIRSTLPSGQRLKKNHDYRWDEQVPEINQLRAFILHPQFSWASQLNAPATSIAHAYWQFVKR